MTILPTCLWCADFLNCLFSYSEILIPILVFVCASRRYGWFQYNDEYSQSYQFCAFLRKFVSRFVYGRCYGGVLPLIRIPQSESSSSHYIIHQKSESPAQLLFCASGLMINYTLWGVLQEKLMTGVYETTSIDANTSKLILTMERFHDSQFVVMSNRFVAFLLSGVLLSVFQLNLCSAPLYLFMFASLSNILSSWCQYEALKFVDFPTQVVAKASKIIPTMLVGVLLGRRQYSRRQYLAGVVMTAGVSCFLLLGKSDRRTVDTAGAGSEEPWLSGAVLLLGYVALDAFTSNWQSVLFSKHQVSSVAMMCAVNAFSLVFTAVGVVQSDAGTSAKLSPLSTWSWALSNPRLFRDLFITSLCSAGGQLFVFFTISRFGAVNFAVIMTTRQAVSVLLSCWLFGHPVSLIGYLSLALFFSGLAWHTMSKRKQPTSSQAK